MPALHKELGGSRPLLRTGRRPTQMLPIQALGLNLKLQLNNLLRDSPLFNLLNSHGASLCQLNQCRYLNTTGAPNRTPSNKGKVAALAGT
mmetsp:Transcript_7889/g.13565  ORF Transcript_7889/g.13565 Transcript_7889/m.13565 type:complete len:90 (+) Transcript_7889:673-942(+)